MTNDYKEESTKRHKLSFFWLFNEAIAKIGEYQSDNESKKLEVFDQSSKKCSFVIPTP